MPQTTSKMSFKDCKIEVDLNQAGTWAANLSGSSNRVTPSGGDIPVEDAHTFDGDNPLQTYGKAPGRRIRVQAIFNNVANEAWDLLADAFANKTPLQIRYSPGGGTSGHERFTSAPGGRVVTPPEPGGEAGSASVVVVEFEIACAYITRDTVA